MPMVTYRYTCGHSRTYARQYSAMRTVDRPYHCGNCNISREPNSQVSIRRRQELMAARWRETASGLLTVVEVTVGDKQQIESGAAELARVLPSR
jgi:hypothetical protein